MNRKVAVTLLLILFAGIALFAHISTNTLEFSRYNRAWNGTSGLFTELDAHNAHDLVLYDDLAVRNDTLLLLIAPNKSFSDREIVAIRYFIENGNTLFIADETGASNPLLEQLQKNTRVQPVVISSMQREFIQTSSVIAYTRKPDPLLANVYSLALNRPSFLNSGEILASTSFFSWEDADMNYTTNVNTSLSSYGILARERVGRGTLYVLSDPSVFVNGMREARISSDNEVFIQNLLSLHRDILVDQSHSMTGEVDSFLAAAFWVKNSIFTKISVLILLILFVMAAFWRRWL
jgi:hypothetical protein